MIRSMSSATVGSSVISPTTCPVGSTPTSVRPPTSAALVITGALAAITTWAHDSSLPRRIARPSFNKLASDAPVSFDVVVVDGYGRLSPNRRELRVILEHLRAAGVTTIVLRPTAGRRFAKAVANFALADVLGEATS